MPGFLDAIDLLALTLDGHEGSSEATHKRSLEAFATTKGNRVFKATAKEKMAAAPLKAEEGEACVCGQKMALPRN